MQTSGVVGRKEHILKATTSILHPQRKQSPEHLLTSHSNKETVLLHHRREKMKLGCVLPLLLGLLLLSSVKEAELLVESSNSVRIPEHTCQKKIGTDQCKPERCEQECSMEPKGRGECVDDVCSCSFYCLRPPV